VDTSDQPTNEQRQALESLGLRPEELRRFLNAEPVVFPIQSQREPGIAVVQLATARLRGGIVEVRDPGGGLKTLMRFRSQCFRVAKLFGGAELELSGAAVINARLAGILQNMGFVERIDQCPDELGDESMSILARVFTVT
jgi:hypothetical protein